MARKSNISALTWLSRHADFRTALDADQAEFRAVIMKSASAEEGIRDDLWSSQMDIDSSDPHPSWFKQQEAIEERIRGISEEIERRVLILGNRYPFRVNGSQIEYVPSQTGVYEFCLATTVSPTLTEGILAKLPVAFEILVRDVLKIFLGASSTGFRTGWPRVKADKMPSRAKALFALVNKETGEWIWNPRDGRIDDPNPTDVKDFGLDVLAWRSMPDRRTGHHFVLAQCACGKGDWKNKFKDIDLDELGSWFRPYTYAEPTRCFCVPFHIGNTSTLEDVSRKAGLTLDRTRIALLSEDHADYIVRSAMRPYFEWIEIVAEAGLRREKKKRNKKRAINQRLS